MTEKITNNNYTIDAKGHKNYMDGISYDLSPFMTLYVMATSSFFGQDAYYENVRRTDEKTEEEQKNIHYLEKFFGSFGVHVHDMMVSGNNRAEAMKKAIEDSLDYDTELTLNFLAWLRTKAFIRTTPATGLAIASHHKNIRGTNLLRTVSDEVLSRPDDACRCLEYSMKTYGRTIPNGLKKAVAKRLNKANEYELAKYANKGKKKGIGLKDAIRLSHAHSEAINKLFNDELKQTNEDTQTWEAIISTEGSNHETWTRAVETMGHMALLRNLRNLESHDVDPELFTAKLVEGAKTGKQLPFRYYSAWFNVKSAKIQEALEKCIDISIENLPTLPGKSLILVDNSGSATATHVSELSDVRVSVCGNLMGVLTGLISDKAKIGVFGNKVLYFPINKNVKECALELLESVNETGRHVGEATENGIWLALKDIIDSGEKFDRIFIYSDMQAGHGGLYGFESEKYPRYEDKGRYAYYIDVPQLVQKYREEVNPDCKLYSIQIGGYSDNIMPEFYPNTCILGGWNTEILQFVSRYEQDMKNVEQTFRDMFTKNPDKKGETDD